MAGTSAEAGSCGPLGWVTEATDSRDSGIHPRVKRAHSKGVLAKGLPHEQRFSAGLI